MKLHWKILIWLAAGVLVGVFIQQVFEAPPWIGIDLPTADQDPAVIQGVAENSPAQKSGMKEGEHVVGLTLRKNQDDEQTHDIDTTGDLRRQLALLKNGTPLWLVLEGPTAENRRMVVGMSPEAPRSLWLEPFRFVADVFMRLLKMLIIPLVLTSIISGVAGLGGGKDFGRLGGKTLAYYLSTSILAAGLGLLLINIVTPGDGAALGLGATDVPGKKESLSKVLREAIPTNVFSAFSDPNNRQMLQVIIFALLFGFFISKVSKEYRDTLIRFFNAAFEVMMALARFVMSLVPYGVFCLLVKVVGETGLGVFKPLLMYMGTITIGLVLHCMVTLPLLLRFVGKISPLRWARSMSPALLTAFSTSSSAGTLPVTMETVQEKGGVSNRTASFVLPLGATVNMDGTALYECAGVIFLSQYYVSTGAMPALTFGDQVFVVLLALLASIGAAGIPSAGLVLMVTILSALNMPVEGAALLLAVDRPLDMMRTVANVWSDSCGTAIIARSEGEDLTSALTKH